MNFTALLNYIMVLTCQLLQYAFMDTRFFDGPGCDSYASVCHLCGYISNHLNTTGRKTCFINSLLSDIPHMEGALEATVYEEHIILQWQQIGGVYTSAKLLSCTDEMTCQTIYNFTENSFMFFVLNSKYERVNYIMQVDQQEDHVLNKSFVVQDKRCSSRKLIYIHSIYILISLFVS